MKLQSVLDPAFAAYGHVLEGFDFSELLAVLAQQEKPADSVVYVPSCAALEATAAFADLRDRQYGGMPIQIGYCNGNNTKLNCLEYHRDSEVNIAVSDTILLLAKQSDMVNWQLDTDTVAAFLVPAGTAVEVYATTLHYAPCNGVDDGFQVAIVLPRGTNEAMPKFTPASAEDRLMTACNKWLLAHPESSEAADGAHIGLVGENLDTAELL